jgi:hypothetical protein
VPHIQNICSLISCHDFDLKSGGETASHITCFVFHEFASIQTATVSANKVSVYHFIVSMLYLSNNQVAEDEMGGPCSTNGGEDYRV